MISPDNLGKRLVAILLFAGCITSSSGADEQRERIPDGCRELANRVGLPLSLTHAEATRAIALLRLASSQDPAVARCRQAMLRR